MKKPKSKDELEPVKKVDEQRKELKLILPQSEEGQPIITFQYGQTSLSIPIPFQIIKESMKKVKCNNRSIVEIFGLKLSIDIP